MKSDGQTLEVEITIPPAKGRKGGRSPAVPKVPDPPRIPRIARLMALAIKFQDMVDHGDVRDYADIARLGSRFARPAHADYEPAEFGAGDPREHPLHGFFEDEPSIH